MTEQLQKLNKMLMNMVTPPNMDTNSKKEKFQFAMMFSTFDTIVMLLGVLAYYTIMSFYLYVTIYGGKQAFDSLFSFSNWTYYIGAIIVLYLIIYHGMGKSSSGIEETIPLGAVLFIIICMILYVKFVQNKQLYLL